MTGEVVYTVGGSEAASACGVDPYRSRVELWAEKLGRVTRLPTEAMDLGNALQERVAELVTERHGYAVLPAPASGFVHPERRWQTGRPDGFVDVDGARGILEVKTRGQSWTDDTAALGHYVIQLQHYMAVTGLDVGVLAVLHGGYGGMALYVQVFPRDDSLIDIVTEREHEFLELVRAEQLPAPDGSDSAGDTLRSLFPGEVGSQARASRELWDRHVLPARELAETIKRAKDQHERHLQAIQAAMGDATELISPWDEPVAKWTPYTSKRLDTKALREARPDVAGEFTRETTARRFTLD